MGVRVREYHEDDLVLDLTLITHFRCGQCLDDVVVFPTCTAPRCPDCGVFALPVHPQPQITPAEA